MYVKQTLRKPQSFFWRYLLCGILIFFVASCSSDDDGDDGGDPPVAEWELEVEEVIAAMEPYKDFEAAKTAGWNVEATPFVPGMGFHYINPSYVDKVFDMNKPEAILVADLGNGMEVLGVEYIVSVDDPAQPGNPPEGFTGNVDQWAFNTDINAWTLHLWIYLDNPAGVFNPTNSNVPQQ